MDISAISIRRGIRETDYGDFLAAEFLKHECMRGQTPDESLTEAEFLVAVCVRAPLWATELQGTAPVARTRVLLMLILTQCVHTGLAEAG